MTKIKGIEEVMGHELHVGDGDWGREDNMEIGGWEPGGRGRGGKGGGEEDGSGASEGIGRSSELGDWGRWHDGIWLWRLGFSTAGSPFYTTK
jgi:hypothetical protein